MFWTAKIRLAPGHSIEPHLLEELLAEVSFDNDESGEEEVAPADEPDVEFAPDHSPIRPTSHDMDDSDE